MAGEDIVLIPATSLPAPLREQRWTPTPEMLGNLEAGKTEVKVLALELEEDGGGDLDSAHSVWASLDERDGTQFAGSITSSPLDRDGFRVGDRLEAPLDRVFDFQIMEENGAGRLNEDRARFALGKRILVGITRVDPDGELTEQLQYVGRLIHVDPNQGLERRAPPTISQGFGLSAGTTRSGSASAEAGDRLLPEAVCLGARGVGLDDHTAALLSTVFFEPLHRLEAVWRVLLLVSMKKGRLSSNGR
jgi:hypothetical protein